METTQLLPDNLDEAIEILKDFYSSKLDEIKSLTEDSFSSSSHFGAGTFIRDSWFLWWHENHGYKSWPKEKPKLIEFFNNLNIYHGDDISSIILISFHRSLNNKPINIEEQLKVYFNHWKKQGFKDGIFKPGN